LHPEKLLLGIFVNCSEQFTAALRRKILPVRLDMCFIYAIVKKNVIHAPEKN
jgi:hypothetical protein